jgi:cyclohexa-1,5-dienecarbonyl-CoA hydratase
LGEELVNERVQCELLEDGALLRVVFERDKGNVLTGALMRQIDGALAEHADAKALRLVTLEGAGKHFSFGASVEEHRKDQAAAMLTTFHALIRRVAKYPVPVAAVVRGRCLGGAFEVALACQLVFAAPDAVFACPEIKLGVVPPVLAALGPLRLGQPTAARLLLSGADFDAKAALACGWLTELAAEGTDPFATARAWYQKHLAELSAFAIRQGTEALRRGSALTAAVGATLSDIEHLYVDRLLPSFDGNEGIEAFLAKRKPSWRHE